MGEVADFFGEVGLVEGLPELCVGGLGVGVAEVVCDGAGEEPGVLGDGGAGLGGLFGGELVDVLAVDGEGSCLEGEGAAEEREEGGFSGAAGALDGDFFSGGDGEGEVGEEGATAVVVADVVGTDDGVGCGGGGGLWGWGGVFGCGGCA